MLFKLFEEDNFLSSIPEEPFSKPPVHLLLPGKGIHSLYPPCARLYPQKNLLVSGLLRKPRKEKVLSDEFLRIF